MLGGRNGDREDHARGLAPAARAIYPQGLVFRRGIAFAAPERGPIKLVVCFSVDNPKRACALARHDGRSGGKFSRNFIYLNVVFFNVVLVKVKRLLLG
jgi:hypothetical protein